MAITPADLNKQSGKIVDVAKSVSALSVMIQKQGAKAADLAKASNGKPFTDQAYAEFSRACKAGIVGKDHLFKEIKVLMETCSTFQKMLDEAEKQLKPKKK